MNIKKADFIKSSVHKNDLPPELENIEFAFVGRSNVGKSSLINSITFRNKLARTSKTPGRTQLINYFLINNEFYIVDLPGYGFAKVPKSIKEKWNNIIGSYLANNRNKIVFVLLDIRRIPSEEDIEMLKWLEYNNLDYKIIFTKIDKLSNNEKFNQLKKIKNKLVFNNEDVFFHSSLNNKGREEILSFIERNLIKVT